MFSRRTMNEKKLFRKIAFLNITGSLAFLALLSWMSSKPLGLLSAAVGVVAMLAFVLSTRGSS